jgi:hypothetical protein
MSCGHFIELEDAWLRRRVRLPDQRVVPCDWVVLGKVSEAVHQGDLVTFGSSLLVIVLIVDSCMSSACKQITRIIAGDAKTYLLGLRYKQSRDCARRSAFVASDEQC